MKNGYFQLVCGPQGTGLKVFAPKDGGEAVNVKEVMEYLTRNQIPYDTPALSKGLQNAAASRQEIYLLMLNREACKEVNESYILLASEDRMSVIVRFYPASENGESLKPQELIRDLRDYTQKGYRVLLLTEWVQIPLRQIGAASEHCRILGRSV